MNRIKIRRALCLCIILILLSLMLIACDGNKLSGTYYSTDGIAQTFTFKGDTVSMSAFGINVTEHIRLMMTSSQSAIRCLEYHMIGSNHFLSPAIRFISAVRSLSRNRRKYAGSTSRKTDLKGNAQHD